MANFEAGALENKKSQAEVEAAFLNSNDPITIGGVEVSRESVNKFLQKEWDRWVIVWAFKWLTGKNPLTEAINAAFDAAKKDPTARLNREIDKASGATPTWKDTESAPKSPSVNPNNPAGIKF